MKSVVALLGPTNTGKTHLALERLLEHDTGMIGFPLRLLARENYDKLVQARGSENVALVTGEERIVPPGARWFACTVEAMPLDRLVDFVAIDEIQLCGDRERGHVFTARLLHARGRQETMFLGADTIRPLLRRLVPEAGVIARPRLSTLSYAEPRKLARLPRRTAVVVFSLQDLYAVAERLRQEAGGAAVVFGALSPRARNAQVGLFQAGDVDYMVATDAIGMGLNLDIEHVAFTSLTKFDGRGPRPLSAAEIGQIAGRAGRHVKDGTFGATSELGAFDPRLVRAIEGHLFEPLEELFWRNSELEYRSTGALLHSLEQRPQQPELKRLSGADDQRAFETLLREPEIADVEGEPAVRLLWDVCCVPDFRNVLSEAHTGLLLQVFRHLRAAGRLPEDWVAAQVAHVERNDGDVDLLLQRIAAVRTWTYLSQRAEWLADARYWQERTRAIEDRLSDALHERLTEQFVDRRASAVVRQERDGLLLALEEDGTVAVQGLAIGRLEGFRFEPDPGLRESSRHLLATAQRMVKAELPARVEALVAAPDSAFALSPAGQLLWRGGAVGRLRAGEDTLHARVEVPPTELEGPLRERVQRRLAAFVSSHLTAQLGPLVHLSQAEFSGPARGLVFALNEGLGAIARRGVAVQTSALTNADRATLASAGVRIGRFAVFVPAVLQAQALPLRTLLFALREGPLAGVLPTGQAVERRDTRVSPALLAVCGYLPAGALAIRMDRLERLAHAVRSAERERREPVPAALAHAAGCAVTDLPLLLHTFGLRQRVPKARSLGAGRK
jgi:ATP-dependent RNA helicase SUPV3L1/SUV3